ncbi:PadR family transcriptional regulator [Paraclostridium ghonii]|uniref:PadR family transcriptional regulator PadR n=1 Tax=Paraclostridium ghonii TaxID=29358 RepID=A0ABU0N5P6_9FIRM|nr:PadR family transcriptional regulator [Paeniclostridium ghonii]MDQ0558021.1 PadR family transcriptional regulator PadR [Paeniclostridium ghonii]
MKNSISSQMLKGILEGCILKIIGQKEIYGYEMNLTLKEYGISTVSDGTIYPLLLKLQKQNLIIGEMRSSDEGPMRKYYKLTDKGKDQLEIFEKEWDVLSNSVNNIFSIK